MCQARLPVLLSLRFAKVEMIPRMNAPGQFARPTVALGRNTVADGRKVPPTACLSAIELVHRKNVAPWLPVMPLSGVEIEALA